MAIGEHALSVQLAIPAAVKVHPCGLWMPLVADEMFASTCTILLAYDFRFAISQVSFPCQYS